MRAFVKNWRSLSEGSTCRGIVDFEFVLITMLKRECGMYFLKDSGRILGGETLAADYIVQ